MANPEAQGFLKKLVENAWSKAGLEPNQPTKTHDDMMKIVDYFQTLGLLVNGGYWDFPKGYFDTEPLGVKVYGANGGMTAYQYLEKMGGFLKYITPILDC